VIAEIQVAAGAFSPPPHVHRRGGESWYVLEGDLDHRGAGQSLEMMRPESTAGVGEWEHRLANIETGADSREAFMGDIIGDLSSRRGTVESTESRGIVQVVRAFVPLAEMFGYATTIRSMTQGRASYAMEPSHYEQVPSNIAEEIRKKNRVEPEAAGSRR